ncbi:PREDICTED: ankyrin repeat and SOCS box protein 11 [Dipodomys ordii]|uniref:Ankyrin repeat and SOCS box protein 11 n=1 Tax=Dipodomys ordii TaxID=10020 RepID=A0A1S3GFS6_DIPOR|nr:PREDICTED: ankyrin repeat and SOCS box protein 11 [Dipodomys ordii]
MTPTVPNSSQAPPLLQLLLTPNAQAYILLLNFVRDSDQDCWADRSPLHEAAAQGRLLALKTLISQGVNVNLLTLNHVSSLHEACLGGHVACARALLESGAQVNGVTIHGATPLFNACCSGSAACVSMLLEHGARAQLDMHLCSPIHEAVKRGHTECMEILLANNVNIDQELPHIGTPLYVACTYEKEDCLKKLLELGANPDQGQWLNTPLHAAAKQSNLEIIYTLVDYGANLRLRNAQGKIPLDLAAPKSSVAQALILCEETPSKIETTCADGQGALYMELCKSNQQRLQPNRFPCFSTPEMGVLFQYQEGPK